MPIRLNRFPFILLKTHANLAAASCCSFPNFDASDGSAFANNPKTFAVSASWLKYSTLLMISFIFSDTSPVYLSIISLILVSSFWIGKAIAVGKSVSDFWTCAISFCIFSIASCIPFVSDFSSGSTHSTMKHLPCSLIITSSALHSSFGLSTLSLQSKLFFSVLISESPVKVKPSVVYALLAA